MANSTALRDDGFKRIGALLPSSLPQAGQVPDFGCPFCGGGLEIREAAGRPIKGCRNFPECQYVDSVIQPEELQRHEVHQRSWARDRRRPAPSEVDGVLVCPLSDGVLQERQGRYGRFLGCEHYPTCKYTWQVSE